MALYVVIPVDQSGLTAIDQRLLHFGAAAYRLTRGEWLVKFDGTPKQLTDHIGITPGEAPRTATNPLGIVLLFSSHWGHASKDVWDWIALNQV